VSILAIISESMQGQRNQQ